MPSCKPKEPHTVLVVDDDAAVRGGAQVRPGESRASTSGSIRRAEALLADNDRPVLGLPGRRLSHARDDGLELVDRLRRRNVMLPAILISGRVSKHLRILAQRSGLTLVLEKPLSDAALVESIRGALAAAA